MYFREIKVKDTARDGGSVCVYLYLYLCFVLSVKNKVEEDEINGLTIGWEVEVDGGHFPRPGDECV